MPTPSGIANLRTQARDRLSAAGVQSAASDADWLLVHVTGRSRAALATLPELTAEQQQQFTALLDRRVAREPLQHILGQAWFRNLTLAVGPGVFVPRPETEVLVDLALAAPSLPPAGTRATVVDLCSGSAAIPLAMATERSATHAFAVELQSAACHWATQNISAYGERLAHQGSSVDLLTGDAGRADELLPGLLGRVDVLTCNPPYIPAGAIPRDPEVRDHDPAAALYGGADGLDVVREVVAVASRLLRPGGYLLIEHGDAQGVDAGALGVPSVVAAAGGFSDIADHFDLTGRPRVTVAVFR